MKCFFKILFFVVAVFAGVGTAEATSLPVGNIKATSFSIFHSPFSINLGGCSLKNTYAADGRKLNYEVSNTKEQFEDYRTYSGNLVFDINDNLDYILMPEGRIINNAGTFTFEYHLRDHLGSTRVAFTTSPDPSQGGGDSISTVQETTYYPFGAPIDRYSWADSTAKKNPYLREGKEYLSEHGWDKADYGGRFFDLWKMFALQIDPLATRYYHISPYALFANNPIRYADPSGNDLWDKVVGWTYGMIDNITGTRFRASYNPTHAYDYNNSLNAADATSVGLGLITLTQGTTMAGGGLIAAPTTGGASLIGSAVGVGVAAEGAYMVSNALDNIGEGNHYGEENTSAANNDNKISSNKGTTETTKARQNKGQDGATSTHIIERDADGNTISKTHQVKDQNGKTIHQHQDFVPQNLPAGEKPQTRQFPDEWVKYPNINTK